MEQGDKGKALPCASFSSQHLMVLELLNFWISAGECKSQIYIQDGVSDSEEGRCCHGKASWLETPRSTHMAAGIPQVKCPFLPERKLMLPPVMEEL